MAIEQNETVASAPKVNPNGQTTYRQPTPTTGQTDAPDILNVLRNTDLAASISPEGTEYIRQLQEFVKSKTAYDVKFEIHTMGFPAESQCIICQKGGHKTGIVLVFDEAITKMGQNIPSVAIQMNAHAQFKSMFPDATLLQLVVITRHDYPKVRAMGSNVINALIGVNKDDLTVDSLKNYKIELVPNVTQVKSFIEKMSGHGVLDRMDFGFLINCVSPNVKMDGNKSFFNQTQDDHSTLAAVSGYTTFIRNNVMYPATPQNPSGCKFFPVVHISSIVTPVQVYGMLGLIIPLAAMSFLDNRQWEAPFKQFGGKSQINLGNLMPGQNGQPYELNNLQEFELFKASYLENPVLVLDVSMGRFMVPGLAGVGMQATENNKVDYDFELKKAIARFLKTDVVSLAGGDSVANMPLGQLAATEYTGTVGMNGTCLDSRYADYLNLMIHNGTQMARLSDLLQPSNNPDLIANLIREFCPDLDLQYFTHRLILNPYLVNTAKAYLQGQVRIISPDAGNNFVNMSLYSNAARDYQQGANAGRGYCTVTSPFMSNPGKLFG